MGIKVADISFCFLKNMEINAYFWGQICYTEKSVQNKCEENVRRLSREEYGRKAE